MIPQTNDLRRWLKEYDRLGSIARDTLMILTHFITPRHARASATDQPASYRHRDETALGADWSEHALTMTLEHLADVREGFQLQLRTTAVPTLAEMRYLVDRALVDWHWLEEMQWQLVEPLAIDVPQTQLMAFAHAYLCLAMLPRLPKTQVTFPRSHPSYADIPVPSSGTEVLLRLEELDRVIYRVLGGARQRVEREPLRRTYGFFESSAWLILIHQRKFKTA